MLHTLLSYFDKRNLISTASAHCDIPCKIYDPSSAQIASLTIIRMMDLIQELSDKETLSLTEQAQFSRLLAEKELHATKVKDEIRVIWGDYFKQPQFDQFPDTHKLAHKIMLQASKCKQTLARDASTDLLALVNEFASTFWKTKGVETFTATCPYPPAESVIYPKLAED